MTSIEESKLKDESKIRAITCKSNSILLIDLNSIIQDRKE